MASASLSPSASKSPSSSKSPSASLSKSPSSSKSPSASISRSSSVSRSASRSLSTSASISISRSASISPSFSLSISPSASASIEATSIFIRDEIDAYDWGVYQTGSDGILRVFRPSNTQNGDCLVVIIGKQDDPDITPPAGWTTGAEGSSTDGNDVFGGIYYKFITDINSEPDPDLSEYYEFTSAGVNEQAGWWCGALVNVSQTNTEDVAFTGAGMWANLQNDISPNAPAVTTATDDALAFACWVINSDPGADTFPASPWVVRAGQVGGNGVLTVFSKNIFVISSTGSPEVAGLISGQDTEVGTFVFRKAGASPSPSASISISKSASLSPSRSASPSVSRSFSQSRSESPSVSPSLSPSASESISPSASVSLSPSASPSASPSISPTVSESFSLSISASASASHSISPSAAPRYKVRVQMMQ